VEKNDKKAGLEVYTRILKVYAARNGKLEIYTIALM
jgi:hypothetical protein